MRERQLSFAKANLVVVPVHEHRLDHIIVLGKLNSAKEYQKIRGAKQCCGGDGSADESCLLGHFGPGLFQLPLQERGRV